METTRLCFVWWPLLFHGVLPVWRFLPHMYSDFLRCSDCPDSPHTAVFTFCVATSPTPAPEARFWRLRRVTGGVWFGGYCLSLQDCPACRGGYDFFAVLYGFMWEQTPSSLQAEGS